MTSFVFPTAQTASVVDDILSVNQGLVIVYSPKADSLKAAVNGVFTELRTRFGDEEKSVFLNFDKETSIPRTNNLSFFYDIGVLDEFKGKERDDALLGVFIRSVMSPDLKRGNWWDRVAQDAPYQFLPAAVQSAALGGRVVISVTAGSAQEVVNKFAGMGDGVRKALAKLVAVSAAEDGSALFTVTDADDGFWGSVVFPVVEAEPFPAFADLGGPDVVSNVLLNSYSGLALVSGRVFAGKTLMLAAVAGELSRSGRHVVAVRSLDASIIPGIEERVTVDFDDALLRNILTVNRPDVVVIDEIRSPEAARFAVELVKGGLLVIASMHANDPKRALSHFLFHCGGESNYVVAESLIFSYGMSLVPFENEEQVQNEIIAGNVLKAEEMFKNAYHSNHPSRYNAHKYLASEFVFPDTELRKWITAYSIKATAPQD